MGTRQPRTQNPRPHWGQGPSEGRAGPAGSVRGNSPRAQAATLRPVSGHQCCHKCQGSWTSPKGQRPRPGSRWRHGQSRPAGSPGGLGIGRGLREGCEGWGMERRGPAGTPLVLPSMPPDPAYPLPRHPPPLPPQPPGSQPSQRLHPRQPSPIPFPRHLLLTSGLVLRSVPVPTHPLFGVPPLAPWGPHLP